jgi:hypothetical protein
MTRAPDAGHVDDIEFECRRPDGSKDLSQQATIDIFSDEPAGYSFGDSEGDQYFVDCMSSDSGFANGINIRATDSVEALDLDCSGENVGTNHGPLVVQQPPLQYHPGTIGDIGVTQRVPATCSPPWVAVSNPAVLDPKWITQSIKAGDTTILCARPAVALNLPSTPTTHTKVDVPPPYDFPGVTSRIGNCLTDPHGLQCQIDKGGIHPSAFCPNGQPRAADGSCPQSQSNVDLSAVATSPSTTCPNGATRTKLGCPTSTGSVNLKPWSPNGKPAWHH